MGLFESFRVLTPAQRAAFARHALADDDLAAAVLPSAAQERIIFLSAIKGGAVTYNLPWAGRVTGGLDIGALGEAFRRLLRRHEQLRRRFVRADDQLLALGADDEEPAVEHLARPGLGTGDRDRDAWERARADAARPFEVMGGPLARLTTVEYAEDDHLVLLTVHHAVADGWSLEIVYRDLSELYTAVADGRTGPSTAPSTGGYSDYVRLEWRAAADGSREVALTRWGEILDGAPSGIELPVDRPRPRTQDFRGADAERTLSAETSRAVRTLGAAAGATPFMTCLALFGHTLSRYCGNRDIVVGTPVAGRPSAEFDEVVGMFVNTVPVRLRIGVRETLGQSIAGVRVACLESFEMQDVPLDAVVDRFASARDIGRPPLFQVAFTYVGEQGEARPPTLGAAEVRPVGVAGTTAKFELSLTVHERVDGQLHAVLEYARALFDPRTAERILAAFEAVAALAADPGSDPREAGFPAYAVPERPQELAPVTWDDPATVLELVADAAAAAPSAVAIRAEGEEYTYERLLAEAHQLAGVLAGHGVGPGFRVGLMLERTPRLLVSMLAVFAAGGAYVPLDPTYPAPRLAFMLEDCGCAALVTDDGAVPDGLPATIPVVDPAAGAGSSGAAPAHRRALASPAGAVGEAYVLYTSGSTGVPKGVSIPHRAVLAMVHGTWQIFGPDCLRHSLAATSASFDVSTVELFPTLGLGGTVRLVRSLFEIPPAGTGDRPTFTAGVPSLLGAALEGGTLDVTGIAVAAGGESLRADLVRRLHMAGAARVVNIYGPSEDCTYSTSALVPPDGEPPPIGQPVPGSRAYVLDPDGFALPLGAIGEIHLAGSGLADGYVHRPSLTAARFVPDPFSDRPGRRMYRTGDLGRFRPDGELEYAGRIDRQVKINGMRIELGEVESAVLRIGDVLQCAAVVQEGGGHARLAAVVRARSPLDVKAVRQTLQETLPRHLVPTAMVQVERIPHLPNGKVDTDAVLATLPPLGATPAPSAGPEPDPGPVTATVRRLWSKVLPGSDGTGDFFAAGGNSLSALRLVLLLRDEFAVPFDIADVFAARTAAEMVLFVERSTTSLPASRPVDEDDERRTGLSREQFRLWFLEQVGDPGPAYLIPMGWELTGPLDVPALTESFARLQEVHPALRLRVHEVGGVPRTFDGGATELRRTEGAAEEGQHEVAARFAAFASVPLDLDGGPLVAGELVSLAEERHLLLIAAHHLVLDGWSVGVLEEDLSAHYAESAGGTGKPVEPAGADYRDHVVRQAERLASPRTADAVETWRGLLEDAPTVLRLPRDRPAVERTSRGSSQRFTLSAPASDALRSLADDLRLTPFMASSLVFGLTLMEFGDVDDVLMGTPVSGRYDRAFERTVGMFVNTIVLRLDARGNPSINELARRYSTFGEAAYAHQDVPLDLVVEAVKPVRSASHSPLFQVLFSYDYGFGDGLTMPGLAVRELDEPGTTSKFDLSATVGGEQRDFDHLTLEYSADLFGPEDVRLLAVRFKAIAISTARGRALTVDDHIVRRRRRTNARGSE